MWTHLRWTHRSCSWSSFKKKQHFDDTFRIHVRRTEARVPLKPSLHILLRLIMSRNSLFCINTNLLFSFEVVFLLKVPIRSVTDEWMHYFLRVRSYCNLSCVAESWSRRSFSLFLQVRKQNFHSNPQIVFERLKLMLRLMLWGGEKKSRSKFEAFNCLIVMKQGGGNSKIKIK